MTFRRVVLRAAAEMLAWLVVLVAGAMTALVGFALGCGWR
jgi:hypothetical protein